MGNETLILIVLSLFVYLIYVSFLYRDTFDKHHKLIQLYNINIRIIRKYEKFIERIAKMITREEIEQFKKDCVARGLKLPNPCIDEWCKEQIKELYEDINNGD